MHVIRCLTVIVLLILSLPVLAECYTVVAGRKATADGSVLVAHNEDDAGDIVVNLRKVAGRTYAGPVRTALNAKATFDAPVRTMGYLWLETTTMDYADAFVNEAGVVVVSNSCPSKEHEEDLSEGGMGYLLRRLVAEQATSAREAVRIAGALIEKHGYSGSGRTYTFADAREGWMLSVIQGRHWAARRVPDDQVAVIPNHYIIHELDLTDAAKVQTSPGLLEYAIRRGFYDPKRDGVFDFARAFNTTPSGERLRNGNTLRHWRGLTRLSGRDWKLDDSFPFSFSPGRPVTPASLMELLRDHFEGTPYDRTEGYRKGTPNYSDLRTICTRTTIHALVARLRSDVPKPLSTLLFLSLAKPDTTLFVPFYASISELPEGLGFGETSHDYDRMWKEHWLPSTAFPARTSLIREAMLDVERTVEADYGTLHPMVRKALDPLEHDLIQALPAFEQAWKALSSTDPQAAQELLNTQAHGAFARAATVTHRLQTQVKSKPPPNLRIQN